MMIDAFENKLFPLASGNCYEKFEEESGDEEGKFDIAVGGEDIDDKPPSEQIKELDKLYGTDLIKYYFMEKSLMQILKTLKEYRKDPKNYQIHNNLITRLNFGIERLENDINNMAKMK